MLFKARSVHRVRKHGMDGFTRIPALPLSNREWIQLVAPCLKSLSSRAVSLRTILKVLKISTCFSTCGSVPRYTAETKAPKSNKNNDYV